MYMHTLISNEIKFNFIPIHIEIISTRSNPQGLGVDWSTILEMISKNWVYRDYQRAFVCGIEPPGYMGHGVSYVYVCMYQHSSVTPGRISTNLGTFMNDKEHHKARPPNTHRNGMCTSTDLKTLCIRTRLDNDALIRTRRGRLFEHCMRQVPTQHHREFT